MWSNARGKMHYGAIRVCRRCVEAAKKRSCNLCGGDART